MNPDELEIYRADPGPRGHQYLPILGREGAVPVYVHYPVLCPGGGILMCTTEADQVRVATELNLMHALLKRCRPILAVVAADCPADEGPFSAAVNQLVADLETYLGVKR